MAVVALAFFFLLPVLSLLSASFGIIVVGIVVSGSIAAVVAVGGAIVLLIVDKFVIMEVVAEISALGGAVVLAAVVL